MFQIYLVKYLVETFYKDLFKHKQISLFFHDMKISLLPVSFIHSSLWTPILSCNNLPIRTLSKNDVRIKHSSYEREIYLYTFYYLFVYHLIVSREEIKIDQNQISSHSTIWVLKSVMIHSTMHEKNLRILKSLDASVRVSKEVPSCAQSS